MTPTMMDAAGPRTYLLDLQTTAGARESGVPPAHSASCDSTTVLPLLPHPAY